jgi:hypothetical protein
MFRPGASGKFSPRVGEIAVLTFLSFFFIIKTSTLTGAASFYMSCHPVEKEELIPFFGIPGTNQEVKSSF